MTDAQPQRLDLSEPEIDLGRVGKVLVGQWLLLVSFMTVAVLLALIYLHAATYKYSVELAITPVENQNNLLQAGGLGGLAALAGVNLPDGTTQKFPLYLNSLTSRSVAEVLARNDYLVRNAFPTEWSEEAQAWQEPAGLLRWTITAVKVILGAQNEPWSPPGAARLQNYLRDEVSVAQDRMSLTVTLSMNHEDVQFAASLLTSLHQAADKALRRRDLERTSGHIAHLTKRLETITVVEYRQALVDLLAEQEKAYMVASSDLPFVAQTFGDAFASEEPTTPNPFFVVMFAVFGGTILGGIVILLRGRRQLRSSV